VEYDFFVSQMRKYEQYIISILEHISELEEQKRMVKEKMEQTEQKELKKKTKKRQIKSRPKHVKTNTVLMAQNTFAIFWEQI
jgi:phage shock protein A